MVEALQSSNMKLNHLPRMLEHGVKIRFKFFCWIEINIWIKTSASLHPCTTSLHLFVPVVRVHAFYPCTVLPIAPVAFRLFGFSEWENYSVLACKFQVLRSSHQTHCSPKPFPVRNHFEWMKMLFQQWYFVFSLARYLPHVCDLRNEINWKPKTLSED